MEVRVQAFVQDFGQFLDGSGLNVVQELLQAGLGGGALGFRSCAAVRGGSGGDGTGTLVLSLERAFSSRLVCLYTRVLYLNWKSGMEARYPVCMHESFSESCH